MERRNRTTKSVGNGEGTLYYSEALKCWIYQYYVEGDSKRKTMKQRKNESSREFKARVTDLKNKLNNGTYIGTNKEVFIDILERHVEQKYKDNITQDSSYERDLNTVKEIKKTCANFCNKPIQKIKVEDIEIAKDLIREYSNNSIDKIWRLINKTFKIALSRRKIVFNPMDDENLIKPVSSKITQQTTALTIKERESFLSSLEYFTEAKQYKQIVLLEFHTGMRIGEILALSQDCINLTENTITVKQTLTRIKNKYIVKDHTKTYDRKTNIDKGKRTFPMSPIVKTIITEILANNITNINKLLFWDYEHNSVINPRKINDFLDKLNRNYKISKDLTTHKLRKTFITRCREEEIPLPVIQAMVGHVEGSPVTDETYTAVSLDFMKKQLDKIS